jgi:shikimate kinase
VFLPASRKGIRERTIEKTGVKQIETSFPVSSGRNSSMALPLAATISWFLAPEKLPKYAKFLDYE